MSIPSHDYPLTGLTVIIDRLAGQEYGERKLLGRSGRLYSQAGWVIYCAYRCDYVQRKDARCRHYNGVMERVCEYPEP